MFAGEFHADFTGYPGSSGPGGGRTANDYEGGGSGGGHGARGGRGKSGYFSSYSYDSIYIPEDYGSGGGNSPGGSGGRGGGKVKENKAFFTYCQTLEIDFMEIS